MPQKIEDRGIMESKFPMSIDQKIFIEIPQMA